MEIFFLGKVDENGILQGIPRKKLAAELKMFTGKSVELVIRKKKKYRSIQQNRYQWLVYTMVSDHTCYTKDEVHEICKSLFLKTEKANEANGAVYEYVKSTTELSTTEHMEYLEAIRKWAAEEFGMNIPEPNEQIKIFSNEL